MSIHRTKLNYGILKIKAYEKIIWMIELGTKYIFSDKSVFLYSTLKVHSERSLVLRLVMRFMKDCFQTNLLREAKLKYVAMKLKTFVKYESLNLM